MQFLDRYKNLVGIVLVVFIVIGSGILIWESGSNEKEETTVNSEEGKDEEITIDIEGAVLKPGIYKLSEGSILEDAIKISGGLTKKADKATIAKDMNRAEKIRDGQKIYFPFIGTVAGAGTGSSASTGTISGKVNINTASISQLDTLPGIGPAYAQRIIDYRSANGGFKSPEEIMEISGIGEKTYEKIKDLISI